MVGRLRKYFISGLVVSIPLSLSAYLFILVVEAADGLLGKYIEPYFIEKFGFYFQGTSILVGILFLLAIGFFATNFLGKKIYTFFERVLLKLPFFRQVYPAIKEMALFLFSREKLAFKQVVFLEYPRRGLFSIAFLTNDSAEKICEKTGQELCNVFIPSAPGPLTGYVILAPRKDLILADITVEEAIKFIVSGGVVNPS